MKRFSLYLFSLLVVLTSQNLFAQRIKQTINENWFFRLGENKDLPINDSELGPEWLAVSLPHTYNNIDAFTPPSGYYAGMGWYRKNLTLHAEQLKGRVFLYFEGANQEAELYVNGTLIGTHTGGYTAFAFDITKAAKVGKNVLAVKVNNYIGKDIAPISADFTFYGGIYRDVHLITTANTHFSVEKLAAPGVMVSTPKVDTNRAEVQLKLAILNQSKTPQALQLVTTMVSPAGQEFNIERSNLSLKVSADIQEFKRSLKPVIKPQLWSPDQPNLYTVRTQLIDKKTGVILDEENHSIGFRFFRFDPDLGFFLNGKPTKLMGACRHQDWQGKGNALSDDLHRYDMKLLKDMGANFIRIAHYPQDPAILEACDKLGIMAWEEIPIVNEIGWSPRFKQTSMVQVSEMIAQHRNHPSVIIWGYMNESLLGRKPAEEREEHERRTVALAKTLDSLVRATDPSRYTAMALHNSDRYNISGLADIAQITGWNLYHGWYHDSYEDFGKFMDRERAKYPKRIHIISEYGAGMDRRLHTANPIRYDFSMQHGEGYHESYYKQIMERPYIAGVSLWNLVDFGSEGRKETMRNINNKGLLTMDRTKKDIFHFYRAALSKEPVVYIATRDQAYRKIRVRNNLRITKIPIKIYTNALEVELLVNGRTQGKQKPNNHTIVFEAAVNPGHNILLATYKTIEGKLITDDIADLVVDFEPENTSLFFPVGKELALNCGSYVNYHDPNYPFIWEADRAYYKGGFGAIGGHHAQFGNRPANTDDIFGTDMDPLFQSRRDSMEAYQFDVPDGQYEVELLFAETDARNRVILNDIGAAGTDKKPSEREFTVLVNGTPVLPSLNLARDAGINISVWKKTNVRLSKSQGLRIDFKAEKGNPCISGIKIRRVS